MIYCRNLKEELRSLRGIIDETYVKCPACPKVCTYYKFSMAHLRQRFIIKTELLFKGLHALHIIHNLNIFYGIKPSS